MSPRSSAPPPVAYSRSLAGVVDPEPRQYGHPDYDDERPIDVLAYLLAIRQQWKVVVAALVGGVVVAGIYSWTRVPLYRSSMKLIAVPAHLDARTPTRLEPADVVAYLPFVRNADALQRAVKEVGLDTPENRWKTGGLSSNLKPTVSREGPIMELVLDFPDPVVGPKLLSAIASQAIALNRGMVTRSDKESRDFLKAQLTQTETEMREQEKEVLAFRDRAQLEVRRKQLDMLLSEVGRLEEVLHDTTIKSSELGSMVSAIAQQLENQPRILSLNRSMADEPDAGAAAAARPFSSATFKSEVLNPLFEQSEPLLVEQRGKLAGSQAAADRIQADLRRIRQEISGMATRVTADELEADRLKAQLDTLRRSYGAIAEQYRVASVAVAAQSADLKVFEEPRGGNSPVSPRTSLNLLYGAAGGFGLGLFLAIGLAVARESQRADATRDRVAS